MFTEEDHHTGDSILGEALSMALDGHCRNSLCQITTEDLRMNLITGADLNLSMNSDLRNSIIGLGFTLTKDLQNSIEDILQMLIKDIFQNLIEGSLQTLMEDILQN